MTLMRYGCASGYSEGFRLRIVCIEDWNRPSSAGSPRVPERLAPPNRNALLSRYSTAQRTGPSPPSSGEPLRVTTRVTLHAVDVDLLALRERRAAQVLEQELARRFLFRPRLQRDLHDRVLVACVYARMRSRWFSMVQPFGKAIVMPMSA